MITYHPECGYVYYRIMMDNPKEENKWIELHRTDDYDEAVSKTIILRNALPNRTINLIEVRWSASSHSLKI